MATLLLPKEIIQAPLRPLKPRTAFNKRLIGFPERNILSTDTQKGLKELCFKILNDGKYYYTATKFNSYYWAL